MAHITNPYESVSRSQIILPVFFSKYPISFLQQSHWIGVNLVKKNVTS